MKPFPDWYAGRIVGIIRNHDNSLSLSYWARREGCVVQVAWGSVEGYLEEFPGHPIEVATRLPTADAVNT